MGALIWIALIPLGILLAHYKQTNNSKKITLTLFLFGAIHNALFHRWFFWLNAWIEFKFIILLSIGYAIFTGLFYALGGWITHKITQTKEQFIAVLPFTWVCVEYIKSLGIMGNSAGTLGYTQTAILPILQWASWIGVFGLTFLIVTINMLAARYYLNRKIPLLPLILLVTCYGIGYLQFKTPLPANNTLPVTIIQGNHSQHIKLNHRYHRKIQTDYLQAIKASQASESTLFIFPETFTPSLNLKDRAFINKAKKEISKSNSAILLGTPRKENNHFYNSAAILTKNGTSPPIYDKYRLMPFGEYWPFKHILIKLGFKQWVSGAEYTAGKTEHLLTWNNNKPGISLCLESIYPWHSRAQVIKGADILVVLVNNAWFFNSPAAAEHLQMTQLRAVETGRTALQAGNTGISAIITPKGQIKSSLALDIKGTLSSTVPTYTHRTLYTKVGDLIVFISVVVLFAIPYRSN